MNQAGPTVVAIPARDEAGAIAACLEALDMQRGAQLDHIVLLLNNCTDATAAVARAVALRPGTALHVLERALPPAQANAGHARRLAMSAAANLAGPHGTLLTTDADGQVDDTWLAANLAALDAGADVVAGWVELHPIDWGRIPAILHEDDARECAYDALCDEIHARLDPDPADPWPRHTQNSGASIAVTAACYARSGGVPDIASGEDRALMAALRRVDARIRHSPEVHVTVSGRTEGRSQGGMADTIRRRLVKPDVFLDDRLEPASACVRRARCRAALRTAYAGGAAIPQQLPGWLALPHSAVAEFLRAPYFGAAWEAAEMAAPNLRRSLVPVAELAQRMAEAAAMLAPLRSRAGPADRSGSPAGRPSLAAGAPG